MIITNTDPEIDLTDPDWLEVKRIAKAQGDWYGRRTSSIPPKQQIVNLWYLYAWLKYNNYDFHAGAAIASVMWFASGINGGAWGTGRVNRYTEPQSGSWTAHHIDNDPEQPIDYWFQYRKAYPSNAATLQGSSSASTTSWQSLDWIVNPALDPEALETLVSCPSYGLSQWTPAIPLIYRIMDDADAYYTGIGLHYTDGWVRWWPDNPTLQLFMMDWQNYKSDNTLPQNQYGSSYHAEWVHDQIVTGYSTPMTWTEFKNGAAAADYALDMDKFNHSCYNWLSHYIQAHLASQMTDRKTDRENAYVMYIRPAFLAWDADGGAGLFDIPAPPGTLFTPGTWNDPINSLYSSLILKRRKKQNVRTVLC